MSIKAKLVQIACDVSNQMRDVKEVDVEDLLQKPSPDCVMIDVRPEEERSVSIIPGAIRFEEFEESPDAFAGKQLVAYCTAGYRSGVYAQQMKAKGYEVVNLRGGILSWCQHEQPLSDNNGQHTHKVHVYGKMWNLVSAPYEGVW